MKRVGIVLIEIQCYGLRLLYSKDHILDDVKVTENIAMMPLIKGLMAWVEKLYGMHVYEWHSELQAIRDAGYDITTEVKMLEFMYCDYSRELPNYDNSG